MNSSAMWERIQDVFGQAIELAPDARAAFLSEACGDDPELLRQVTVLLQAHESLEASADTAFPEALNASLASVLIEDVSGELQEGTPVGRYRIVRRAGRGGMGVVYLAHDPRLDRPVALKLLPRWRTADAAANRRLEEEARAASALNHPNIATVYEIGESDEGRLFIAMAWYEGGTLRERLTGTPLPVDAATAVARQLAEGLAAAHAGGIVHRDVKPENVAFGRDGRATILDFGLASAVSRGPGGSGPTPGTAAYMSPEQARGEEAGPRGDLWALGVVLYEMLAGRRPFGVDGTGCLRREQLVPLRKLRPEVPRPLAEVVHRCLEVDPAHRFQSADEVLDAFREASADGTERSRSLRRLAPVAGVYLVAAGLLFLAVVEVAGRYLLPEWFPPAVLALLAVGFPVVAATALWTGERPGALAAGGLLPSGVLTWRRTLGGGVFAFGAVAVAVAAMVASGTPRITAASGAAGTGFDERPWVVLTDFDASEGAEAVALAAREALAVDLSQSRHVSVYGRQQVAQIMGRMGGTPEGRLDLITALEIAERAGAGAVLTGSVAAMGSQYVLTGRAVDPATGEELFAVRAAAGEARLLGAVERLSREMRRRLGEERAQIRQSRPLPEVSTPSLEALRLYAAAEEQHMRLDYARSEALAEEAIRLDPGFAMAHGLAAAAAVSRLSYGRSAQHITRAFELRDRLTERERRHVEAVYFLHVAFDPVRGANAYRLLLAHHPRDARAWNNLGATLHSWMGDTEGAYAAFTRASEADPDAGFAVANAAHMAAIAGRLAEADSLASRTRALGMEGFEARWRMGRAFAQGDIHAATAICDSLLAVRSGTGGPADDAELCGSIDVAAGRVGIGLARLEAVTHEYVRAGRHRNVAHAAHALAMGHQLRGETGLAAARIASAMEQIPSEGFAEPDRYITRTNLRVHAALLGQSDLVRQIGDAYPPYHDPSHWFARFAESLVIAAGAVAEGDGEAALRALDAGRTEGLMPIGWRVWDALLRGLAHEAAGRPDDAAPHLHYAAEPGYLLPPYLAKDRILQPIALEALARVEAMRGNDEAAQHVRQRLARLQALADPEVSRPGAEHKTQNRGG